MGKTSATVKDRYNSKAYDDIRLRVKKGGKERLKAAATATGQSTNGFIRATLNKAVQDATGAPMEPDNEEYIPDGSDK
ncbi:MAG: antitoxin [Oscillospiraceae bacterium]|nr:antitoxin [Oscillospiraceae bacterium]